MTSILFQLLFTTFLAKAHGARIIPCDESKPQMVHVPLGRVVTLNFPITPKDAVPGEGGFDLKRIQQDLVIKTLRAGASTNLIVYLESRRCFFHLVAGGIGDESIFVRDPKEKTIEVQFVEK
jgi:hypothetical protein